MRSVLVLSAIGRKRYLCKTILCPKSEVPFLTVIQAVFFSSQVRIWKHTLEFGLGLWLMITILSVRSKLGAICKNDSTVRPTLCLQVPLLYLWHCTCVCSIYGAVLQPEVMKILSSFFFLSLTGKLLAFLQMYCIANYVPSVAILSLFSAVICIAFSLLPWFCSISETWQVAVSCMFLPSTVLPLCQPQVRGRKWAGRCGAPEPHLPVDFWILV